MMRLCMPGKANPSIKDSVAHVVLVILNGMKLTYVELPVTQCVCLFKGKGHV